MIEEVFELRRIDVRNFVNQLKIEHNQYFLANEKYIIAKGNFEFISRSYEYTTVNNAHLYKTKCEISLRNASEKMLETYKQYELFLDISTNPKNAEEVFNVLTVMFSKVSISRP
jgi:hypothetical protein